VAPVHVHVQVPVAKPQQQNADQLIAGAGRTVYEFKGAHTEEARSGGRHQTFMSDGSDLGAVPLREERHTNLRTSGTSIVVGGLGVVVLSGVLAFFLMSEGAKNANGQPAEPPEVVAAPAAAPEPAPTPPVDPATVPPTEGTPVPPVDPAATPNGAAAVEPPKPAEEPKPAPAEQPKPAEETAPAEPVKKKSTSTKKKTTPAPAPEPEPEKKRKISPISPSKPPRDGLNNLPAPD
jgi:hypothetical protein